MLLISQSKFNDILSKRVYLLSYPNDALNPIIVEDAIIENNSGVEFNSRNAQNTGLISIIFKNCIFKNRLIIKDQSESGIVELNNCKFQSDVQVQSYGNVLLKHQNHFSRGLKINSNSSTETIIQDLLIEDELEITGNSNSLVLENIKSTKANHLFIKINLSCNELKIFDVNAKNISTLSNTFIHSSFEIENCNTIDFNISHFGKINTLDILESKIENLITNNSNNTSLKIFRKSHITKIIINASKFNSVFIEESTINEIKIFDTLNTGSVFKIQKTELNKIEIQNLANNGFISFSAISINPNGIFSIRSSNLGKCDFIKNNFEKGFFEFENSKISDSFITETDFPDKVYLNGTENHKQAQLAFGQLSTAFLKHGDSIRCIEYKSREIESHYNDLTLFSDGIKNISFTKINLFWNKYSNDFGRSWIRGVMFTFVFGLFFYSLFLTSLKGNLPCNSTEKIEFLIQNYIKFINPIRLYDIEKIINRDQKITLELTWISHLIDFWGRIFIAYGIYQTIQAFRKFGK